MDQIIKEKSIQEIDAWQYRYFSRVFMWLGIALAFTGIVAMYTVSSPFLLNLFLGNPIVMIAMIGVELFLVFRISRGIHRLNGQQMTMSLVIYSIVNGITISYIFLIYTYSSIATVFFIASAMFMALFILGYFIKIDMTKFSSFFGIALVGLLVTMVFGLIFNLSGIQLGVSIIGVLLFAGLTIYDGQKLKQISLMSMEDEDQFQRYVVWGALNIYLDLINIFLFLLRIFGGRD